MNELRLILLSALGCLLFWLVYRYLLVPYLL